MSGKQGVSILSPSGNVEFRSADDLKFEAQDSSVSHLSDKHVIITNIYRALIFLILTLINECPIGGGGGKTIVTTCLTAVCFADVAYNTLF